MAIKESAMVLHIYIGVSLRVSAIKLIVCHIIILLYPVLVVAFTNCPAFLYILCAWAIFTRHLNLATLLLSEKWYRVIHENGTRNPVLLLFVNCHAKEYVISHFWCSLFQFLIRIFFLSFLFSYEFWHRHVRLFYVYIWLTLQ